MSAEKAVNIAINTACGRRPKTLAEVVQDANTSAVESLYLNDFSPAIGFRREGSHVVLNVKPKSSVAQE